MWQPHFAHIIFLTYACHFAAAAAARSLQQYLTLCNPRNGSPPGSSVPGILQARILEWVAISFSNACMHACMLSHFSCVQLSATPWTAAHQAPLSTRFSKQEHWSGLPFPSCLSLQGSTFGNKTQRREPNKCPVYPIQCITGYLHSGCCGTFLILQEK